ncbi:MAG: chain length-determining protein [Gammaproteobacteria bacterium]|nr:chain length-determining protein [Gammaproteobacteria bacterium]MBU1555306.1 chain length-determining protein [Gammaproteobacteria bacterium]MBU2069242.1 chain length-determining protein [Gammaproteobacteria bacterium]MBU2182337.1 chain length-determining protein [Gammaproteobacteria bacterium]MBU2204891.1 chain length-determining protein [Gammaproteobacteria bacterium]
MKELQQAIEQLYTYLQGIWLRRRYIVITAWLVCPIGWFFVYNLPPTYEANAKLYVETSTVLQPLLQGLALRTNNDDEIKLMARTLLSRPNLEKIARATDLDITATTDKEFEELIDTLQKTITISASGRENIYVISYSNPQPQLALKVVQETLNNFVEGQLGSSRADTQTAERFLTSQITDYERRLMEAELRLSDFKKNRLNLLPGNENDYYSQINNEKKKLEEARLTLRELETRLASAKSQMVGEEPVFGVMPFTGSAGRPATQFDDRIRALQSQLDNLLIRYTEFHPDVLETKRLLQQLEQQRDDELQQLAQLSAEQPGSSANLNQNAVYQELRISVSRLETEVASVKVRVKAYEENVAALVSKLNLIPEIEAEFTGLNRDYDITKSKYEALLSRRESAELSRRAGASEQDVQFNVIEPPRVPLAPSGPNRALFYTLVLAVGIGAGIVMAFLRSMISPVLTRASQLQSISDFPVFGVVSHTNKSTILRQVRMHFLYFALLAASLMFCFILLLTNEMLFGRSAELLSRFVG